MTWVGTPFVDQSDIKHAGVDCVMLATRVFVDCGIVEPFDPRPYPPRGMHHRDDEILMNWIIRLGGVETDECKPGNLVAYKEGRCLSHCAIILPGDNVVHASWLAREVIVVPVFDVKLTHNQRDGRPREMKIYELGARSV